jgi:hypothetical protein
MDAVQSQRRKRRRQHDLLTETVDYEHDAIGNTCEHRRE